MSGTASPGISASLRNLLSSAVEMLHIRIELIETELELEKRRLFDGILLAALAMMMMSVGLLLMSGLIIMLVMEGNRWGMTLSLSLLFISLGTLLIGLSRLHLKNPAGVFHASKAELQSDDAVLKSFNTKKRE